jgi:hypothetical protein
MRLTVLGLVLAVLGAVALWLGGIPYTDTETFELGPIEATAEVEERFEIPPILAGSIMALGVGLVVYAKGRR